MRRKKPTCPTCNGDGYINISNNPIPEICPDCRGWGIMDEFWGWDDDDIAEAEADRKYHALKDEGRL